MNGIVAITLGFVCLLATAYGKYVLTQPKQLGRSVLDEVPLIDGHNDFPYNLYNIEQNQLANFTFNSNLLENVKWTSHERASHTDLPRLRAGKVGGQVGHVAYVHFICLPIPKFWVAYVHCDAHNKDAVQLTLDQIDVIKRLVAMNRNDMKLVTTADGIMDAFNEKKIASIICVEGGHSIDSRMAVLRLYYELGARYLSLTHNCNLPWADQNQMDQAENVDAAKIGGLSEWGKNLILEMNRLGMMVDLSHVAKAVMIDALAVSVAPVIFSHSSAYAVTAHSRNVHDDVLLLLAQNRGIVMVNFYNLFVATGDATIRDVVLHLEHIRNLIGIEYIGIGADYDGVQATPVGLEDVTKYPDLFDMLANRGWSNDDLKKLAGLNLIRVFKEVEATRDRLVGMQPYDIPIPYADLIATNETFACRSDFENRAKTIFDMTEL